MVPCVRTDSVCLSYFSVYVMFDYKNKNVQIRSPPRSYSDRIRSSDSAGFGRIRSDLVEFGQFRSDLVEFGRIWSNLVEFGRSGRIWSDSVGFGRIRSESLLGGDLKY